MKTYTKAEIIKAIRSKRKLIHTICLGGCELTISLSKSEFLKTFDAIEATDTGTLGHVIITEQYVIV